MELVSHSPERTQALGRALGENARPGDVLLLVGGLGSGKTCLTQGVLWGLGSDEFARSPTFVLVAQYEARHTLYHMDLYRLETFEEVVDLGLDEMLFGDGVSVVEWADKGAGAFPEIHLLIRLEYVDEETRRISLRPSGSRYEELVQAIKPALAGWQET
ncbi:MAG: tRNA (adenosine(37)-N6)-threonylcarbamoyltransferase complex ATPase subunit type 1 TsaE [Chloroflexi bacterium]|nr:tRNA (adenosine(37)-N6)-threonylcarbamoyltransferase complex ATPase subunit type 1 TsaE [Chloroflexota bacterium]